MRPKPGKPHGMIGVRASAGAVMLLLNACTLCIAEFAVPRLGPRALNSSTAVKYALIKEKASCGAPSKQLAGAQCSGNTCTKAYPVSVCATKCKEVGCRFFSFNPTSGACYSVTTSSAVCNEGWGDGSPYNFYERQGEGLPPPTAVSASIWGIDCMYD